jgi:ABC-type uncharacterized transport system permease subunit
LIKRCFEICPIFVLVNVFFHIKTFYAVNIGNNHRKKAVNVLIIHRMKHIELLPEKLQIFGIYKAGSDLSITMFFIKVVALLPVLQHSLGIFQSPISVITIFRQTLCGLKKMNGNPAKTPVQFRMASTLL